MDPYLGEDPWAVLQAFVLLSAIFALVQKGVLKWYDGVKAAADGN